MFKRDNIAMLNYQIFFAIYTLFLLPRINTAIIEEYICESISWYDYELCPVDQMITVNNKLYQKFSIIENRINRLEVLALQRTDLVEDYKEKLKGDRTIVDILSGSVIRLLKSRKLFPESKKLKELLRLTGAPKA